MKYEIISMHIFVQSCVKLGVCGCWVLNVCECARQKRTFVVKEGQWRGTFFTVVTLKHKIHFSKLLIHFSRDSDLANDLSIATRMFIRCSTAEIVSK